MPWKGRLSPAGLMLLYCVGMLLPLASAGVFRIWVFQDTLRLGYALSMQETHVATLDQTVRALEVELASLKSAETLERMAAAHGLAPAKSAQRFGKADAHLALRVDGAEADHGTP